MLPGNLTSPTLFFLGFEEAFQRSGICVYQAQRVRRLCRTTTENSYIVLSTKTDHHATANQMANPFLVSTAKWISRKIWLGVCMKDTLRPKTYFVCPIVESSQLCPFEMMPSASHLARKFGPTCVLFSEFLHGYFQDDKHYHSNIRYVVVYDQLTDQINSNLR